LEINRQPNRELLDHAKKRQVELKCIEVEELMESQGYGEAEIEEKINEYRRLLLAQVASGEFEADVDTNGRVVARDSHTRAELAATGRDRMRAALGIKADFVAGSSMDNLKKVCDAEKKVDETPARKEVPAVKVEPMMAVESTELKADKKKRVRRAPSSSSSSSSDGSSSSSESSSDSEEPRSPKRRKRTPPQQSDQRIGERSPPLAAHRNRVDSNRRDKASSSSDSRSPSPRRQMQSTVHVVSWKPRL